LPGRTGSFALKYNNESTTLLSNTSKAIDIENALLALAGIDAVTVAGSGTSRDPWRVTIGSATKDSKGGYFVLEATNLNVVHAPADIADAAATTRPSISLNTPVNYQRVFYDFSAENVEVRGGGGDDLFISDDGIAAL